MADLSDLIVPAGLVTPDGDQTLTNKTLNSPTVNGLVSGTAVTQTKIDETADRITRVGDFGIGGECVPPDASISIDDNTLPNGFYRYGGGTTLGTNPIGANGWWMHLQRDGGVRAHQVYFSQGSVDLYVRTYDGTAWTAWLEQVGTNNPQMLWNKTLVSPAVSGAVTEGIYNLTGTDLNPANGTIQYKVLTGGVTLTESLADGQSVLLRIAGGDTYTVTWPTVTWVGGSAPTLTANDQLVFWQESGVVYANYLGSVA